MSASALLAAVAAACAVAGAWHAAAAVEQAAVARVARRLLAPAGSAAGATGTVSAGDRRRLAIVGAASLLAGGWTVAGPIGGMLAAATGPWAVARLVASRRRRWQRRLAADAPALARALADALAGGHSIRGAIGQAALPASLGPAAAAEVRACAAALALGEPTAAALHRLAERAGHTAYDTLVAAILIQREAGGDLAGLLRQLADDVEDAQRVEDEARVTTAQARLTGWIVAGLPAGAAVVIEAAAPGSLGAMLASPAPAALAAAAMGLQVVALAAIHRLARVGRS